MALYVGMHAWIALDRHCDRRVRLDVPHSVDQIASVLSPQLQANLTPQFARGQGFAGLTGSDVAETNFRDLICSLVRGRANNRPGAWRIDREQTVGQHGNDAIGDAYIITFDWLCRRSGRFLSKGARRPSDEGQDC